MSPPVYKIDEQSEDKGPPVYVIDEPARVVAPPIIKTAPPPRPPAAPAAKQAAARPAAAPAAKQTAPRPMPLPARGMNTPASKRRARSLFVETEEDSGWIGTVGKFIAGAILGELLAVLTLFLAIWCGLEDIWNGFGPSVLGGFPILFGVFGIVWFDQVTGACRKFVEWFHSA